MDINELLPKFDEYSLKARLQPGLYILLPVIVTGWVWSRDVFNMINTLLSIFIACGAFYLLSHLVRRRGKALENKLIAKWGGWPTTYMMRHRDTAIDVGTKSRYKATLGRSYPGGWSAPTSQQEESNPIQSDEAYRAVTTWLIGRTRDKKRFPLLFKENVSYGFRRNLLGSKPLGLILSLVCVGFNFVALLTPAAKTVAHESAYGFSALALSIIAAIVWIALINREFVREAAEAYAIQLFATIDDLEK